MTMDSWSDDDADNLGFDDIDPTGEDDTLDLGLDFDDDPLDEDDDDALDVDVDEGDDGVDADHEPPTGEVPPLIDEVDGDHPVGDPDVDLAGDDAAFEPQFPPELDVDPLPEPVDGPPWTDAGLLGNTVDPGGDQVWNSAYESPSPADLHGWDGSNGSDWDSLLASDDPAVSSLARWWQP